MSEMKFKKTIKGAQKFYESIEKYEDSLSLRYEFEAAFKPEDIEYDREIKFYMWLRNNKL